MAAHKQVMMVHFSFGPHFSKSNVKSARRQFEREGPFDMYSPEVALAQGQSGLYARNLRIKNELILRANLKEKPRASKTRVPDDIFKALGESHDFGDFARNEYEFCFQKRLPYLPLSIHEIPLAQADICSIEGRVREDIAWERTFIANLRPNLEQAIEAMRDVWPFLAELDTLRVFARFGTEHSPIYSLAQKAYSDDSSMRFTCSFDRKSDERGFRMMAESDAFDHADVETRVRWMEFLARRFDLSLLIDDIRQVPRILELLLKK